MLFQKSFSLVAGATIAFSPVIAFAQEVQVNEQNASNSATAVGDGNVIYQNTDQTNIQNQNDGYGYYPEYPAQSDYPSEQPSPSPENTVRMNQNAQYFGDPTQFQPSRYPSRHRHGWYGW